MVGIRLCKFSQGILSFKKNLPEKLREVLKTKLFNIA